MANSIQTTGQLRDFMANMMIGLKDGSVKPDVASRLTKMFATMNESVYAEIKSAKMLLELKRTVPELGELAIGGKKAPK